MKCTSGTHFRKKENTKTSASPVSAKLISVSAESTNKPYVTYELYIVIYIDDTAKPVKQKC